MYNNTCRKVSAALLKHLALSKHSCTKENHSPVHSFQAFGPDSSDRSNVRVPSSCLLTLHKCRTFYTKTSHIITRIENLSKALLKHLVLSKHSCIREDSRQSPWVKPSGLTLGYRRDVKALLVRFARSECFLDVFLVCKLMRSLIDCLRSLSFKPHLGHVITLAGRKLLQNEQLE